MGRISEPSTVWCSLAGLTKNKVKQRYPWYTRTSSCEFFSSKTTKNNQRKQKNSCHHHVWNKNHVQVIQAVPFSSPSWRSRFTPLTRVTWTHHPKKVTDWITRGWFNDIKLIIHAASQLATSATIYIYLRPLSMATGCLVLNPKKPKNPQFARDWLGKSSPTHLKESYTEIIIWWLIYWRFRWFSLYYRFSCATFAHPKHQRVAGLHWNPGDAFRRSRFRIFRGRLGGLEVGQNLIW